MLNICIKGTCGIILSFNSSRNSGGGGKSTDKGSYRVHILHKGTQTWYELQDLHVVDVLPQMITLSESYIQIYEMRLPANEETMKE